MADTPRDRLARALYIQRNYRCGDAEWRHALAWYEAEVLKPDGSGHTSEVGKCIRQAEATLRWIAAAGLTVTASEASGDPERQEPAR